MTHSDWVDPEDYSARLYASCWWTLFPTNDYRSTLTWSNRLGNFRNAEVYNFYSSGEEVLREYDDDPPFSEFGTATLLINYWNNHPPISSYAWVWQEKGKGRALVDSVLGSTHGGWKLNTAYNTNNARLPAAQANLLPASQLQTNAFFDFGSASFASDLALQGSLGNTYAYYYHNRILADAIPAMTWAIGSHPVPTPGIVVQNVDMMTLENGWPQDRLNSREGNNWHHSDFREVAYPFTYKLFNQLVTTGNLK
jgi:hypothetical protein